MAGDIIAEFLTAIRFVADEGSARRAESTARRVERTVRTADAATTRSSIAGTSARIIASNRESGIRTRGAAELIAEHRQARAAEAAKTVQVVRAARIRIGAEGAANAQQSRFNAASIGYAARVASASRLTALAVVGTTAAIASAAISATHVIAKMADGFEKLFYTAQRTGSSAGGLRSFGYAASQLGASQQEALGSLEEISSRIRRSPGFETMLKGLGVETHDAAGNVLAFEKRVLSLGRALAKKPEHQQYAYADALGIGENTLRALTSGEMEKAFNEYQAMMAKAGLDPDKADRDSKKFMDVYRRLSASVNIIATRIQGALVGSFGAQIEKLTNYLLDNADRIAQGATRIGDGILKAVDAIVKLIGQFNDLDPKTKETVIQIAALAAAMILFNSGPIGALIAAGAALAVFASPENIEKLKALWQGFDRVAKAITGQDGLTAALSLLGAAMVLKVIGPLTSVIGMLATLGALKPPPWLLKLLGVEAIRAVATGHDFQTNEEYQNSLRADPRAKAFDDARRAGSSYGTAPQGQVYDRENDNRSLKEKLLPKWMGGKDAPMKPAEGAAAGGGAPQGDGTGTRGSAKTGEMMSYAVDQLRREGVPEANLKQAAAHLVGQAQMESGLNPNLSHDGGTGFGIYGARDPTPGRGRRTDMFNWLEKNGYARNSAEGQMRYMTHEAMSGKYPNTKRILMGEGSGNLTGDTNTITREFESPAVVNHRSPAVANALRVGPTEAQASASDKPEEAGTFPNGAPRVLKPDSMKDAPGETMAEADARRARAKGPIEVTLPEQSVIADRKAELQKSMDAAKNFNDRFSDSFSGVPGGSTPAFRNAPPLGVGPQSSNTDSRSYRGGDVKIEVSGVSDPKEAASLTERAVRSREADTLRNMRSAFA